MTATPAHREGIKKLRRLHYEVRGHSRKLLPIISSLDRLDHDEQAWQHVRERVSRVEQTSASLLELVDSTFKNTTNTNNENQDTRMHDLQKIVHQLSDHTKAALCAQHDLFTEHRKVCVTALALRESSVSEMCGE
jgi:hypothetical protein